jgi:type III secretion protein V
MDLAAAARRYALLAIGDGLVSQIPALLVAVAAGVAVTRVSAEEEGGSLGGEIGRQIVAEPRALAAVAALLAALALAPGLPALPFAALAAAAALGAHRLGKARASSPATEAASAVQGPAGLAEPFGPAAPIAIELGPDLLAMARGTGGPLSTGGLDELRERVWRELGVRLPVIAVRGGDLASDAWVLRMDDVPAARGTAPAGEAIVLAAPDELALVGIEAVAEEDPLTGRTVSRVRVDDAPRASALGPVRSPLDRVVAEVAWTLSRAAHHFVGVQEAQVLLDALEPAAPALVREASRQLPPALLAEVLRRLVEEGVSIRPLRTILEALLETGATQRGGAVLAEMARRALRRHIGHRSAADGFLTALLLDPAAEDAVRGALAGDTLALDPSVASALLDALEREIARLADAPVLLASPDVRRALRGLLATRFPRVAVLAYEELPPELPIRPVGKLAIAACAA